LRCSALLPKRSEGARSVHIHAEAPRTNLWGLRAVGPRLKARVRNPVHVRLARNLAFGAAAEVLVRVVSLATVIYIAHALTPSDFGALAVAQAAVGYVWLLGELAGSAPHATREIAAHRDRADRLIVEFLGSRIVAGSCLAILWLAGVMLFDLTNQYRAALASGALFFVCFPWYADWILRGLEKLNVLPLAGLAVSATFCGLTLVLTLAQLPVWTLVAAWSVSYLVGAMVILSAVSTLLRSGSRSGLRIGTWREHLQGSAAFAIAGALTLGLVQLPLVTLGIYGVSSNEVGYLAAPLRIIALIVSAGQVLGWAAYPVLASLQQDQVRLRTTESILQRAALVLGVGVAAVGWPLAPAIVPLLLGQHFAASLPVFQLLVLVTPIWFAVQTLEWMVLARGGERRRVTGFAVASGVLILGLLWAARAGTAIAVAQVICLALVAAAVSLVFVYIRDEPTGTVDAKLWRTILAGILTAGVLQTLPSHVVASAVALPLFALTLLATRSVTREDLTTFRRLYARV
jgi:O-antigen/teichoic acid export membrane protein